MGSEQRKIPTRERIASQALALFNRRGVARVTTAEIAAAARMREGNLHYHFARKEQLIETLYEEFEAAVLSLASRPVEDPSSPPSYRDYQRAWFDLMSAYRCFYRDGNDIFEMAPRLRARVVDLRARTQTLMQQIFETANDLGVMRIEPDELCQLLDNAWIVSSYWMSYKMRDDPEIAAADLEWGFGQMTALFAPYFAKPDPTKPDPTKPDPTEPEPTEPEPTEPDPT